MKNKSPNKKISVTRRDFIKTSAVISLTALGPGAAKIFAEGSDKLRVGVIGCGGRGTYDARNCVKAAPNVEIVALADLFREPIDRFISDFKEQSEDRENLADKLKVTDDNCFVGFDAYKKLLASNIDMVILTEPPHFRPEHLKAAVQAGKHIFTEKPIAVDPPGVRSVIASSELAEQKKLAIVAGTQSRRMAHYREITKRLHNGDIGQILAGQCVRSGGAMRNWYQNTIKRQPDWSDMEWQIRRWLFFTWLSGDFICEMHIHNLDVMNWALGAHPVKCMGMGGRQARTEPEYGDAYDHFAVEYEYPNDVRIEYMGCQIDGFTVRSNQRLVGTKGSAYIDGANSYIEGQNPFKYDGPSPSPVILQHAEHIQSIRSGRPLNEARRVAESTMTAIIGRMSAYTGRALSWDWAMNASKLDLSPPEYKFGDLPKRTVAVPGVTQLI
ncbi:MAG: Gfo/Idh/MocA family protein [Planctomycetota bacterium]|jgi:predicted dehydrogenase